MTDAVYALEAEIIAPVYDTEVTDRVADAMTNIFPGLDPAFDYGELRGTVHDLDHLSELLHRQAILDTARSVFFESRQGNAFSFRLKKQAAFVEVVNFVVDDPGELGAINVHVDIEEPSVEEVIDQIAPRTEDGTPVDT